MVSEAQSPEQLTASDPAGVDAALDVSIILPVYNEAEHLEAEVTRVRAAMDASEYSYEIIVIDDGSSDNSAEVASRIEGIRFIHFLQNRGSGSARKAGTKAARGRVTVWTDVDMTYPNDTIPQLVKELEGYDQVVGARTTEEDYMLCADVMEQRLRKLASAHHRTLKPRGKMAIKDYPTCYGLAICGPRIAVVALSAADPVEGAVRTLVVCDFTDAGQDLWNAVAVAMVCLAARDEARERAGVEEYDEEVRKLMGKMFIRRVDEDQ